MEKEGDLPVINEVRRTRTKLTTSLDCPRTKTRSPQKPLFFVNILIREKKYRQYCGEGLQKIRWLTDCAIYKYENETKKSNLGIAYGLKNENGNLCDLNSRIIDNLENGANVLVLLKEEYESEMKERAKSGGKGNTDLTDDFLKQLKQFNNGMGLDYGEGGDEEDEEDEFIGQGDEEEGDINDDQTLEKEMSQQAEEESKAKNLSGSRNEEKKDGKEENNNKNMESVKPPQKSKNNEDNNEEEKQP